MIKTLSPYYMQIPLTNPLTGVVCASFTLKVYVWNGLKSATPLQPNYTITKLNSTGLSGTDSVNISNIVNDFIDFNCVSYGATSVVYGNNQVWVRVVTFYDDTPNDPSSTVIHLATKGYGYTPDGQNPQLPADSILLTGDEFKVSRKGRFVLPINVGEATQNPMTIQVKSYPSNQINYSTLATTSYDSAQIIKYLWVSISPATTDDYIEITCTRFNEPLTPAVVKTLLITDECRYTPVDIAFQNKEGALQLFTFFKAKRESMNVESERFESNRAIGKHQFIKYNINAKSKIVLNTGFITEDKNETIRQILFSQSVWMLNGTANNIPLNVSTSSHEYKTRQNDRLINYAIEFEYAFNEINNI